jgi:hypothetical protein|tara:strand:- start:137 stop:397 length:261 start_codon:yes stop_codon:yes gene_type:complete
MYMAKKNIPKVKSEKGFSIPLNFVIGLIAIALGGYNLLSMYGKISWGIKVSQTTANIILVIVGLSLWVTGYRLSRHRYHSKQIFEG